MFGMGRCGRPVPRTNRRAGGECRARLTYRSMLPTPIAMTESTVRIQAHRSRHRPGGDVAPRRAHSHVRGSPGARRGTMCPMWLSACPQRGHQRHSIFAGATLLATEWARANSFGVLHWLGARGRLGLRARLRPLRPVAVFLAPPEPPGSAAVALPRGTPRGPRPQRQLRPALPHRRDRALVDARGSRFCRCWE